MRTRSDAETAARDFANKLRTLLTCTVAQEAYVGCLPDPSVAGRFIVAGHLTKSLESRPIRLDTGRPGAFCWLELVMRLYQDHRGYLTVHSSTYQILTGRDADQELLRFDYERSKDNYAGAHLQVQGDSPALTELMTALDQPKKLLHKLHLPVGGRRYRPALEDVLEFLISEGMVKPRLSWRTVLEPSREEFRLVQMKAAIWHEPDLARDTLKEYDAWKKSEDKKVVPHERKRR